MRKIKPEELESLLPETDQECNLCEKYSFQNWENIDTECDQQLGTLGEFEGAEEFINKNSYNEYHPNGTNYWSKTAPIALQYYPYHESQIRACPVCGAIFLSYVEYSGHASQKRLRWVKKELIYFGE